MQPDPECGRRIDDLWSQSVRFGVSLLVSALTLAADIEGGLGRRLLAALGIFLALFVVLTLGLLGRGYGLVRTIEAEAAQPK